MANGEEFVGFNGSTYLGCSEFAATGAAILSFLPPLRRHTGTSDRAIQIRGIEAQLIDLLIGAPGTKGEKQTSSWLRMKINVPKTNYSLMWRRLANSVGRVGAPEAVFDYGLNTARPWFLNLLDQATRGRSIMLNLAHRRNPSCTG